MKSFIAALAMAQGASAIRTHTNAVSLDQEHATGVNTCKQFDPAQTTPAFRTLRDHLKFHCHSNQASLIESPQQLAELQKTLKEGIEQNNLPAVACSIEAALVQLEKSCKTGDEASHTRAIQSSILNKPLEETASVHADPPLAYALQTIIQQGNNAILPPALWLIAAGSDPSQELKSGKTYLEVAHEADEALSQELSHAILEGLIYGQNDGFTAEGTAQKLSNARALLADAKVRLRELAFEESMLFYKLVNAARYQLEYSQRAPALKDASKYLVRSVLPSRCPAAKEQSRINPNSGLVEYGLRLQLAIGIEDNLESLNQVACTLLALGKEIDPASGQFLHAAQLNFQEAKTRDTPLHKAARLVATTGDIEKQKRGTLIIAMLLSAGASANLTNRDGLAPLEVLFNAKNKKKDRRAIGSSLLGGRKKSGLNVDNSRSSELKNRSQKARANRQHIEDQTNPSFVEDEVLRMKTKQLAFVEEEDFDASVDYSVATFVELMTAAVNRKKDALKSGASEEDLKNLFKAKESAKANKVSAKANKGAVSRHSAPKAAFSEISEDDKAIFVQLLNSHALDQATMVQLRSLAKDLDVPVEDVEDVEEGDVPTAEQEDVPKDNEDNIEEEGEAATGSVTDAPVENEHGTAPAHSADDGEDQVLLSAAYLLAYGGNFISETSSVRGVVDLGKLKTSKEEILACVAAHESKYLHSDATLERELLLDALPDLEKAAQSQATIANPVVFSNEDDIVVEDEPEQQEIDLPAPEDDSSTLETAGGDQPEPVEDDGDAAPDA